MYKTSPSCSQFRAVCILTYFLGWKLLEQIKFKMEHIVKVNYLFCPGTDSLIISDSHHMTLARETLGLSEGNWMWRGVHERDRGVLFRFDKYWFLSLTLTTLKYFV